LLQGLTAHNTITTYQAKMSISTTHSLRSITQSHITHFIHITIIFMFLLT